METEVNTILPYFWATLHMPSKPSGYGIKFWLLCDVDVRYTLALEIYAGKVNNVIQRNLSTNVVLRLISTLSDQVKQGRNVSFDRYFTSLDLVNALLEKKMTSLGVVDHKRSFIPGELKIVRNHLYSSWFFLWCKYIIGLPSQTEKATNYLVINHTQHS